ncbi:MAG TPA: YihY/virulence factor BrkB family protein [Polyangiaceae bacterium]|nr:YihY/virulence factor BrkB family protein [Polyangiaceae bacterium]HQF23517.1 YihY/virulence factor BrkB family protein [Polyangiaceae bacterium]
MPIPDRYWDFFRRLRRRIVSIVLALDRHDAVHQASAMAFWLFLGLIPLAAILGWAVTRFTGTEIRRSVLESLISVTPEPALGLVDEQMHRLGDGTEAVAPLSLLGFLWLASGGVHTAIVAIQIAQAGHARSWLRNRSLALAFVLMLVLVATGSTTLLVLASPTWHRIIRGGFVEAGWMQVVRYGALPTATIIAILGTATFFRFASMSPEADVQKRIWPGAIITGLSWVALSWGFSAYVRTIGRYPIFYGSLAAVALLMLWLWLSSFLVLLGSEVNLQIEGTRKTIAPPSIHWPKGWHLRRPIAASPSKQPTNNNDAAPPAADPIESPSGANEPGGS